MHSSARWSGRGQDWRPRQRRHPAVLAGGIIVLWLVASQSIHFAEAASFLAAGGALLAIGITGKRFGLVIPGGILLGLALGRVLAVTTDVAAPELHTASQLLGLAGGFGLIYFLSRIPRLARRDAKWAAITAVAIAGVALVNAALGFVALAWRLLWILSAWWPLLLIALGAALVISRLFRSKARYSVVEVQIGLGQVDGREQ